MGDKITFDYFYGGQEETFSYYRIPRVLFTGQQFKGLSIGAKMLYGLLLDRMYLSSRNGWYDDQGRVYIYYPVEEIEETMGCGHNKPRPMTSPRPMAGRSGLFPWRTGPRR